MNSLGELGNVFEAHRFDGRRSDYFSAGKSAPGNLRLFQQHRPKAEVVQFVWCSTHNNSL
jgi:hypothetical protein